MHDAGIVFLGLSPANLVISGDGTIHPKDFSQAHILTGK